VQYQPKVNAQRQEPLRWSRRSLRWQHPERGLLSSEVNSLAIAEDTGMIVAIGQWVLREACTQMREWLDAGLLAVPVAVTSPP